MAAVPTTRNQILDAAEDIIAVSGLEGASLRAITARAGTNLAAVNYHFGSKDGLVREVLLRHLGPVNRERIRLLDALAESGGGSAATVEAVLDAFLRPAFELVTRQRDRWPVVQRVMGRMLADPSPYLELFRQEFAPVIGRMMALLGAALPALEPATLYFRLNFTVGGMIHYMCCGHHLAEWSGGVCDGSDRERALVELIRFTAAGLGAPAPGGTA